MLNGVRTRSFFQVFLFLAFLGIGGESEAAIKQLEKLYELYDEDLLKNGGILSGHASYMLTSGSWCIEGSGITIPQPNSADVYFMPAGSEAYVNLLNQYLLYQQSQPQQLAQNFQVVHGGSQMHPPEMHPPEMHPPEMHYPQQQYHPAQMYGVYPGQPAYMQAGYPMYSNIPGPFSAHGNMGVPPDVAFAGGSPQLMTYGYQQPVGYPSVNQAPLWNPMATATQIPLTHFPLSVTQFQAPPFNPSFNSPFNSPFNPPFNPATTQPAASTAPLYSFGNFVAGLQVDTVSTTVGLQPDHTEESGVHSQEKVANEPEKVAEELDSGLSTQNSNDGVADEVVSTPMVTPPSLNPESPLAGVDMIPDTSALSSVNVEHSVDSSSPNTNLPLEENERGSDEVSLEADADAQEHEADAQEHEADAQEHEADAQEHEADAQGHEADAQEHEADAQEHEADAQEHEADAQEHEADAQEHEADAQEHEADAQEHEAELAVEAQTFSGYSSSDSPQPEVIPLVLSGEGHKKLNVYPDPIVPGADLDPEASQQPLNEEDRLVSPEPDSPQEAEAQTVAVTQDTEQADEERSVNDPPGVNEDPEGPELKHEEVVPDSTVQAGSDSSTSGGDQGGGATTTLSPTQPSFPSAVPQSQSQSRHRPRRGRQRSSDSDRASTNRRGGGQPVADHQKQPDSTGSTTRPLGPIAAIVQATKKVCCKDGPLNKFFKWLTKHGEKNYKATKKILGFSGKSRSVSKPGKHILGRSSGVTKFAMRSAYSPLRTITKVAIGTTLMLLGGGYTYWYFSSSEASDNDDSSEEAGDEERLNCRQKGVRHSFSSACELLVEEEEAAAQLLMHSGLLHSTHTALPVFAVYQKDGDQVLYKKDWPVEREGLVFGISGFVQERDLKADRQPVYNLKNDYFMEILMRMSRKAVHHLDEEQRKRAHARGMDILSQMIHWCGVPLGKPAKVVHDRCIKWVMNQVKKNPIWYLSGIHQVYFQQQLSMVSQKAGQHTLGLSPVYPAGQANLSGLLEYEARDFIVSDDRSRVINKPVLTESTGVEALVPENVSSKYDLLIWTRGNVWKKVMSDVDSQRALRFIPGKIYGAANPGVRLPYQYLVSTGHRLIKIDELNLGVHKTGIRRPVSWLFVRQLGEVVKDGPETVLWNPAREHRWTSLVMITFLNHLGFQLICPSGITGYCNNQIMAGIVVTAFSLLQWRMLLSINQPIPDKLFARYQRLTELLKHFQNKREYNKANMLLALALNQGVPLGSIIYEDVNKSKRSKTYKPLVLFELKTQIQIFDSTYQTCVKQFGACSEDQREHIEFMRFYMTVCTDSGINGCVNYWSQNANRMRWFGLMHSMDWEDELTSLTPKRGWSDVVIKPEFVRELNMEYNFLINLRVGKSNFFGSDRLLEVDARYFCRASSLENNYSDDEVVNCKMVGTKTLVEFKRPGHVMLVPEFDNRWSRAHWLSFNSGNLLTPHWQKQAQWQSQHVTHLTGTMDEAITAHPLSFTNPVSELIVDTEPQSDIDSGPESVWMVSKTGSYVSSDLDFCNTLSFDNLRILCIGLDLNSRTRKYLTQLEDYGNKRQWVSLLNEEVSEENNLHKKFTIVSKIRFSNLSVERLHIHLELIQAFPALGNQNALDTLLAYVGMIRKGNHTAGIEVYKILYGLVLQENMIERFKDVQSAQCFMDRIAEKHWCLQGEACLIQLPYWVSKEESLYFSWEVKLAQRRSLKSLAPYKLLDTDRKLQFDAEIYKYDLKTFGGVDLELLKLKPVVGPDPSSSSQISIGVEGIPFYVEPKGSDRSDFIFVLERGKLYQGACDKGKIHLADEG